MKLTTTPTTEEFERELTRKGIKAIVHSALVLNECYDAFWNRPTDEILTSINANVIETLTKFGANTAIGTAINEKLALTDQEIRVTVVMPEGYGFDGTQFTYAQSIIDTPVVLEE